MSYTVGDVIDAARDFHRDFNPHVVPDKICFRAVGRLQRTFAEQASRLNEEYLAIKHKFDAGDLEFALEFGEGLRTSYPPLIVLRAEAVSVYDSTASVRVEIIPYSERLQMVTHFPAIYQMTDELYLIDQRTIGEGDHGWADTAKLIVDYVPLPPDPDDPDCEIVLPALFRDSLVLGLASFLATRVGVLDELPDLPDQAASSINNALASVSERDHTTSWHVRTV